MHVFFTEFSRRHDPKCEMHRGQLETYIESPERFEIILDVAQREFAGQCIEITDDSLIAIQRVHDEQFIDFLSSAWGRAEQEGVNDQILPHVWPARTMRSICPDNYYGQLGYYSFDAGTPIGEGTFPSAVASANVAVHGMKKLLETGETVFALCRPPGHHASSDLFGGYCFFNNAAIAAQFALDQGKKRVAILDVDYHHGNGTQDIFYERADVFFASIHGDPTDAYPYFLGYVDEAGRSAGEAFNLNLPLKDGTSWHDYEEALSTALNRIADYSPDVLVISFGADTHEDDPISGFKLTTEDIGKIGKHIAALKLPTLVVMEGGYALQCLGVNVVSFLTGLRS